MPRTNDNGARPPAQCRRRHDQRHALPVQGVAVAHLKVAGAVWLDGRVHGSILPDKAVAPLTDAAGRAAQNARTRPRRAHFLHADGPWARVAQVLRRRPSLVVGFRDTVAPPIG